MTRFEEIPGQEDWTANSRWPSSNSGWRYGVAVASALLLLLVIGCPVGMMF